jgi:uncharacterized protein YegL
MTIALQAYYFLRKEVKPMIDTSPYLLLVFGLDVSGSMKGEGIRHLTDAMEHIISDGQTKENADHIYVGLILFNDRMVSRVPPTPIQKFRMPSLNADGCTDLGMAISEMMTMAQQWKDEMASDFNKKRWCPNLILCSDGAPYLDPKSGRDAVAEYTSIANKAREDSVTTKEESGLSADQHHFHFVPVACGAANRALLKLLRIDQKILDAGNYDGLVLAFNLLGASIAQLSEENHDLVAIAEKETDISNPLTDPIDIGDELDRSFNYMSQF